jgi:hypothetical protein
MHARDLRFLRCLRFPLLLADQARYRRPETPARSLLWFGCGRSAALGRSRACEDRCHCCQFALTPSRASSAPADMSFGRGCREASRDQLAGSCRRFSQHLAKTCAMRLRSRVEGRGSSAAGTAAEFLRRSLSRCLADRPLPALKRLQRPCHRSGNDGNGLCGWRLGKPVAVADRHELISLGVVRSDGWRIPP